MKCLKSRLQRQGERPGPFRKAEIVCFSMAVVPHEAQSSEVPLRIFYMEIINFFFVCETSHF